MLQQFYLCQSNFGVCNFLKPWDEGAWDRFNTCKRFLQLKTFLNILSSIPTNPFSLHSTLTTEKHIQRY